MAMRNTGPTAFTSRYSESVDDLSRLLTEKADIAFAGEVPTIDAVDAQQQLADIAHHFTAAKAAGLTTAQSVLGPDFDPQIKAARDDLERSIRLTTESGLHVDYQDWPHRHSC